MAGNEHPDIKKECEFIKEKAAEEGFKLARQRVVEDMRLKIAKINLMNEELDNPFLAKYADALKSVMREVEDMFR